MRHVDGAMLWAAACMCFFGFLQSGEVVVPSDTAFNKHTHMAAGDVRVDNNTDPHYSEMHIKVLKTDTFRKGVMVYLSNMYADVCPVAAILAYMVLRGGDSFCLWMATI